MSDLVVTVEDVGRLGEKLRFVAGEFDGAQDIAEDYADEVCHGDLAHELEQFAESWKIHRGKLMEGLTTLAELAQSAAEGYDGLETALANALQGEG
ncbi:hypothetical protein [Streptomyces litchfieldiae]|uniref:Excreted virulence factor EspC (Type VII ESX diderm) n=1 Tax=Streptomyces litchfieldiae TaxID=3075543 RepID=A0ABU2MUM9_9ACTN|nr:hypothetical protein [Streptomyces sp. DSM 44938]MDT0345347.1 hypothetical protein [Streptomyces sp. DSM 44938]